MEVDCIIERESGDLTALEIKAGQTFSRNYLRNLILFPEKNFDKEINKAVIWLGKETTTIENIKITSWYDFVENSSAIV